MKENGIEMRQTSWIFKWKLNWEGFWKKKWSGKERYRITELLLKELIDQSSEVLIKGEDEFLREEFFFFVYFKKAKKKGYWGGGLRSLIEDLGGWRDEMLRNENLKEM